jgi:hypothetical protein
VPEQDSLYHKVIDDLYEQVVDPDRPRGSQFDYCEDITEQYIDKMSDIELKYWYATYINKEARRAKEAIKDG